MKRHRHQWHQLVILLLFSFTPVAILLQFPSPACSMDVRLNQQTDSMFKHDLSYVGSTLWADIQAAATAPLNIGKVREISLRQALVGAVIVGGIGGLIALDEDIQDLVQGFNNSDADLLQNTAGAFSIASIIGLYGAGVWNNDAQWRHSAVTGAESYIVTFGLATLAKVSFGRRRPSADKGAHAWFKGGKSFVSDFAAPSFAAAEAVSITFDHAWWVTLPTYAAALAVGVGRLGQNRHWASDILGSAVLGVGTTRLLHFWHSSREKSAVSLSPVTVPGGGLGVQLGLNF